MMAAGRSVFFYHIKFHQLLTQFIVFSLRNRKLSPVYQCDLITLDRTDKFRIYKIAAMDRDQIVSDLFLQVGDTVFYKLFPGCRLYHTFFSKCRNEQNFGYFKKSKRAVFNTGRNTSAVCSTMNFVYQVTVSHFAYCVWKGFFFYDFQFSDRIGDVHMADLRTFFCFFPDKGTSLLSLQKEICTFVSHHTVITGYNAK